LIEALEVIINKVEPRLPKKHGIMPT